MTLVILFVLGIIWGSFINVWGVRYNSGLFLGKHSRCGVCARSLSWFELIPVLSFIFLKGRCRSCQAKIGFRYPLIELISGVVLVSVYLSGLPILLQVISFVIFSLYLVIAIYDSRHKIIPDGLVYSSIVLALALRLIAGISLVDLVGSLALPAFFAGLWFFSKERLMGLGDAKLVLSLALFLGMPQALWAVILAFWIGAIYGLGLIIWAHLKTLLISFKNITIRRGQKLTLKSEIPFAPFLILGAWLAFALPLNIFYVFNW